MFEHPGVCPACGATAPIRSGHACGRQRWRCKGCGRQFTRTTPRGKPATMKQEAVGLYCTGLSMSAVDQRMGVSAQGEALDPEGIRAMNAPRSSGRLIDWECGARDHGRRRRPSLDRLLARLEPWGVWLFCTDDYAP